MSALEQSTGNSQFAIVGSGPSGFYAAEALLRKCPGCTVDIYDRLATPFGLVRGGVAPDHPKIKTVTLVYDKIARSPAVSFLGNVNVGQDVTLAALQAAYHGVILAYGAETDRPLGVPGEQLLGSHAATEFVGWYNGHPDFQDRHFDLKTPTALIIGQGNVAADVARILLTPVDDLRRTDITAKALEALSQSQVKTVVIVGRRGPAQAKFTPTELQELGKIQGCKATINPEQLNLNAASLAEISQPRGEEARKNIKLFEAFCTHQEDAEARRVVFQFLAVPTRINGDTRVHSVTFNRANLAGNPFEQVAIPQADKFRIEAGLVFRCVGYSGTPIAGVDFDQRRGTVVNEKGRCKIDGKPVPGLYVTGWIKRGPSGTIGTNRADSVETVATLLEDLPQLVLTYKSGRAGIRFTGPNSRPVSWADWELIDAAERAQGALTNKPREKLTSLKQMLRVLEP